MACKLWFGAVFAVDWSVKVEGIMGVWLLRPLYCCSKRSVSKICFVLFCS